MCAQYNLCISYSEEYENTRQSKRNKGLFEYVGAHDTLQTYEK